MRNISEITKLDIKDLFCKVATGDEFDEAKAKQGTHKDFIKEIQTNC